MMPKCHCRDSRIPLRPVPYRRRGAGGGQQAKVGGVQQRRVVAQQILGHLPPLKQQRQSQRIVAQLWRTGGGAGEQGRWCPYNIPR